MFYHLLRLIILLPLKLTKQTSSQAMKKKTNLINHHINQKGKNRKYINNLNILDNPFSYQFKENNTIILLTKLCSQALHPSHSTSLPSSFSSNCSTSIETCQTKIKPTHEKENYFNKTPD